MTLVDKWAGALAACLNDAEHSLRPEKRNDSELGYGWTSCEQCRSKAQTS